MQNSTVFFKNMPKIISSGTVVGKKESEGPLSEFFDHHVSDAHFGEKTWEQGESRFQKKALEIALKKASLDISQLSCVFSGDLLNQCIASSFAVRDTSLPFIGLYGACSTFVEGLALAGIFTDGGYVEKSAVCVSSHFCTAERQYRNPIAYGGQRPPTAQRTVTGAGAVILARDDKGDFPHLRSATFGTVVDSGIPDANNMGAAMAPAAYTTLKRHFENTSTTPKDYDLIATGDLGEVGRKTIIDLFSRDGVSLADNYIDCGCEMFDIHRQDMHAGASGCACAATVFSGYLLTGLRSGRWKRLLICGTGSLQSPTSVCQSETIPGICHIVEVEV